jgi:hypothetical protein
MAGTSSSEMDNRIEMIPVTIHYFGWLIPSICRHMYFTRISYETYKMCIGVLALTGKKILLQNTTFQEDMTTLKSIPFFDVMMG